MHLPPKIQFAFKIAFALFVFNLVADILGRYLAPVQIVKNAVINPLATIENITGFTLPGGSK